MKYEEKQTYVTIINTVIILYISYMLLEKSPLDGKLKVNDNLRNPISKTSEQFILCNHNIRYSIIYNFSIETQR